jgi:hypothetical protein
MSLTPEYNLAIYYPGSGDLERAVGKVVTED